MANLRSSSFVQRWILEDRRGKIRISGRVPIEFRYEIDQSNKFRYFSSQNPVTFIVLIFFLFHVIFPPFIDLFKLVERQFFDRFSNIFIISTFRHLNIYIYIVKVERHGYEEQKREILEYSVDTWPKCQFNFSPRIISTLSSNGNAQSGFVAVNKTCVNALISVETQ